MKPIFLALGLLLTGSLISQSRGAVPREGGYFNLRFDRPKAADFAKKLFASTDLRHTDQLEDVANGFHRRFEQVAYGHPVLGRQALLHYDRNGLLTGANGYLATEGQLPATPPETGDATRVSTFEQVARNVVSTAYAIDTGWHVKYQGRVWTNEYPERADLPLLLTHAFEVHHHGAGFSEMIYLDTDGRTVLRHQEHCSLTQRIYEVEEEGTPVWEGQLGDQLVGLNLEQELALSYTRETYNLFRSSFGTDFEDFGDMNIVLNIQHSGCPNAFALGNTTRYCPGYAVDDVVGHEWAHLYIANQSQLLYRLESGSINEGLADIYGEILDRINGEIYHVGSNGNRTGCDDGQVTWKIGEDSPNGSVRDLWSPECMGFPSSRNSEEYYCSPAPSNPFRDNIHQNSGLVTRTFSLLVDGGRLNGIDVTAIGLTRAAHLFNHAQQHYLMPISDFYGLGDALEQSALDLVGEELPGLTTSSFIIFSKDTFWLPEVEAVRRAIEATGLRAVPTCSSATNLDSVAYRSCGGFEIVPHFTQDWEESLAGWSTQQEPASPQSWEVEVWQSLESLPEGRPGKGVASRSQPVVGCGAIEQQIGTNSILSPWIELPPGEAQTIELSFDHYFSLKDGFEGGHLYFADSAATDGEPDIFRMVPPDAFVFNGYNRELFDETGDGNAINTNDNPLGGEYAFTGTDPFTIAGTWGTSVVDLRRLGLEPGDSIRLRWTMSLDQGCDTYFGWFLDDISIGYCAEAALPVTYSSIAATPVKEHIRLDWTTETEEENAGFYLERRVETESTFTRLDFVRGGGNAGQAYRYEDYLVQPGVRYYYRLRQQDFDGTEALSAIVSARANGSARSLRAYPNPVAELLTVETPPLEVGEQQPILLYSSNGTLVRQLVSRGGRDILSTTQLPVGLYWLRVGEDTLRITIVR